MPYAQDSGLLSAKRDDGFEQNRSEVNAQEQVAEKRGSIPEARYTPLPNPIHGSDSRHLTPLPHDPHTHASREPRQRWKLYRQPPMSRIIPINLQRNHNRELCFLIELLGGSVNREIDPA